MEYSYCKMKHYKYYMNCKQESKYFLFDLLQLAYHSCKKSIKIYCSFEVCIHNFIEDYILSEFIPYMVIYFFKHPATNILGLDMNLYSLSVDCKDKFGNLFNYSLSTFLYFFLVRTSTLLNYSDFVYQVFGRTHLP